jgi:hypothetical protein
MMDEEVIISYKTFGTLWALKEKAHVYGWWRAVPEGIALGPNSAWEDILLVANEVLNEG